MSEVKKKQSKLIPIFKSKWTWFAIGILLILGIGSSIGNSNAKILLEEEKVTYHELVSKIRAKEEELSSKSEEIGKMKEEKSGIEKEKEAVLKEIKNKQTEFDEAMEMLKNKNSILADIKSNESKINSQVNELEKIESTITNRKSELAKVEQLIVEKEEEPIQISAGTYLIGMDFPAGRYKAMPVGSGSNFITFDASGRLDVNTILGGFGEPEYIFFAWDGGTIETRSRVKLIAVQ